MNKNLLTNIDPKKLALYFLIAYMFYGCTKEDLQTPNMPEYSQNKPLSMATMDSVPHIPAQDSLTPAQMITVLEHAFLPINWGVYGLIDPDSIQAVANNNHYTDVRIRTPGLPENLATLLWMPCDYHAIREILIQHIDNLKSNDKRVSGMGKVYTERHDLPNDYEIHPGSNPCGMSIEDFEWFTENGWIVVDTSWSKAPKTIWIDTAAWDKAKKTLKQANNDQPQAQKAAKWEPATGNRPVQQLPDPMAIAKFNRARTAGRNRQIRLRQKVI